MIIISLIFSGIIAAGVVFSAIVTIMNRHKILQVHAMVNSRLTDALDKIGHLERIIGGLEQKDKPQGPVT